MSDQLSPEPQKKSCLERAIILSIRALFVLVVGSAIGVGIFFGIQLIFTEYQSLTQDYESRITALENNQTKSSQLVTDQIGDLKTRLETLEIQGDTQKAAIADIESRLDPHDDFRSYQATVVAGQQEIVGNMQDSILAMQTELETIREGLSNFHEDILTLESDTQALGDKVEEYQTVNEEKLAENQTAIESINEIVVETETRLAVIEHQMTFLAAMELLTRARLNLVQGNFTLAQSDIRSARTLMLTLQEELSAPQAEYVGTIIAAIDDLLADLPGAPLTAADKLEGVWQLLAVGLPNQADTVTDLGERSTPTQTPTVTPTPEP